MVASQSPEPVLLQSLFHAIHYALSLETINLSFALDCS